MTLNDPLANVLSHINNNEKLGRKELITRNNSKIIRQALAIMQQEGYVGSHEEIEDGKGKLLKINLLGTINKCGVIKPRYRIKAKDYEKFEKRYLPAMGFGVLIVSTNNGLMTNQQAKEQNLGGTLISFVY